jgi:hypothetical protein
MEEWPTWLWAYRETWCKQAVVFWIQTRGSTRWYSKYSGLMPANYTAVTVAQSAGPNRPNCKFRVVRWCSAVTAWKRAKTLPKLGYNRPDCFTMTMPHLTLPSPPGSFWQNPKWLSHPHQPYTPDLAPCDLLFPKMKLTLKGCIFITLRRFRPICRVLDALTEKKFQEAFQKWRRSDQCLHAGENYFECDGSR